MIEIANRNDNDTIGHLTLVTHRVVEFDLSLDAVREPVWDMVSVS
jgi:hypothetical protein